MTTPYVPTEPWERQPGESEAAFRAFTTYRDLPGKRSLDAVGRQLYPERPQAGRKRGATGHLQRWSVEFHWVERARAWDDHRDAEAREARLGEVRELNKRHQVILNGALGKVIHALNSLDPNSLSPGELLRWMTGVINLQRLVAEQPIEIQRVEHTGKAAVGVCNPAAYGLVPPKLTPQEMAEVLKALHDMGALDDDDCWIDPENEPGPDEPGSPAPGTGPPPPDHLDQAPRRPGPDPSPPLDPDRPRRIARRAGYPVPEHDRD